MCSVINVIDTAEYVKVFKKVNLESSHYKEKLFFSCLY